jgi:PAS domain S-box-containing protein
LPNCIKKRVQTATFGRENQSLVWLFQLKNTFQEMSKYQDNLNNMLCLDVFLMGLSPQERQYLSNQILPNRSVGHILLSFDAISFGFDQLREQISNEALLEKFAKKFDWQIDLKKILLNDFEALVLTNVEREILWVDKGFEKMTGYTAQEVVGKKPTFLQGKNTQESTRLLFREKLALQIPFDITVTNYRKNGAEYLCKVQIFPLFNKHKKISHFLALEREIK